MVYRLSKGSSMDGLAGIYALSQRVAYSQIQIFRPLLQCRKEELRAVCLDAGLEWTEDGSNASLHCTRNYIRDLLSRDPALVQGLQHMYTTISNTRKTMIGAGK